MKTNKGFTLLEVMVAAAILVVSILSALSVFSRSLSQSESDRSFIIAQHEVEKKMEQLLIAANINYAGFKNTYTFAGARRATTFNLTNQEVTGNGTVYAEELVNNNLMRIKAVVCYQQAGRNTCYLNANGTEWLSPCLMETVVVNKDF